MGFSANIVQDFSFFFPMSIPLTQFVFIDIGNFCYTTLYAIALYAIA